MNMKYDSSVMNRLVSATDRHRTEAKRAFVELVRTYQSIGNNDWDDKKKQELDSAMQELTSNMQSFDQELMGYLSHLSKLMVEFENRGGA